VNNYFITQEEVDEVLKLQYYLSYVSTFMAGISVISSDYIIRVVQSIILFTNYYTSYCQCNFMPFFIEPMCGKTPCSFIKVL